MATTTSITTTYAGEFKKKMIAAALLEANTIANGGIEVKAGIKYKEVMKRLALNDVLKNATCDFDATSTVTLTERILEPKELQVNLQLCKKDYHSDWLSIEQGLSAFDVLPKTFQDFLMAQVVAKVAAKNEVNIWRGVAANAGEFDGFSTLLALDADLPAGQEVAGTTVDAANVVAELGKIVDAIPAALYGGENLAIYISQNIYRAYVRSLGGFGASGLGAAGYGSQGNNQAFGDLMFDGVKLFVANGLANNTAVATTKDNLFFGTGLLNDSNEAKVIDMADIDGSQNVRVVMRMTGGVQYGIVEDIVTYGIVNSAN
tara:strand:- start:2886 stop:3836 length:951 start_codon:yes stop_codon:yes gene_type:complete